jgi:hypothetical protein
MLFHSVSGEHAEVFFSIYTGNIFMKIVLLSKICLNARESSLSVLCFIHLGK